MKERLADIGSVSTLALGAGSFTVTNEVLQFVMLILGIASGGFSLYFHIKRFIRERKQG